MKIVVTGKTGTGKTALLKESNLSNRYYADDFVKEVLYTNNHEVVSKIARIFGEDVVENNNVVISKLGSIVLQDKEELEKLNALVAPYVRRWVEDMPDGSIVEMAGYITNEDKYKDVFDRVVLITKQQPVTKDKFKYLDKKVDTIGDIDIDYDVEIKNDSTIHEGAYKLTKN